MKAEQFSFNLLKNIWKKRNGGKVNLLGMLILFAIKNGKTKRTEIIDDCGIICTSFQGAIAPMMKEGLVKYDDQVKCTSYRITEKGERFYNELYLIKHHG